MNHCKTEEKLNFKSTQRSLNMNLESNRKEKAFIGLHKSLESLKKTIFQIDFPEVQK